MAKINLEILLGLVQCLRLGQIKWLIPVHVVSRIELVIELTEVEVA